jgi:electron transport complex protein RnfG
MVRKIRELFSNEIVRMITALAAVGMFSGLILSFVYMYSIPRIEKNKSADTDRAIRNIFPDAKKVEEIKEKKGVFRIYSGGGQLTGYAFTAEGNGYQGLIKLIAGTGPDLDKMKGMEVLESQETPGLGAEIASESFKEQFKGLSVSHKIEYLKNEKPEKPYQIEAITGATISSRAVVKILNKAIEDLKQQINR